MPIDILMPALSPTMTEGNLAKWVKKEGDPVKAGDVIAEIETDKATMEVEAVDEGTMGKILVEEGAQGVKVNAVIALLLGDGESADALSGSGAEPATATSTSAPPQTQPATVSPSAAAALEAAPPNPVPAAAAAPQPTSRAMGGNGRIIASPLAKRLAAQAGLELSKLEGSGPNRRIVKADVEKAASAKPAGKPAPATQPAAAVREAETTPPIQPATPTPSRSTTALSRDQVAALAGNIPFAEIRHTPMRKVIAKRLTESKQTVPHFYLTIECTIDQLLKIRSDLNSRGGDHYKLSVNDFVIRASALALAKVPAANASWSEDSVLQWQQVDVAVAVAIENGLITPIIKNADKKGLQAISTEMRDLGSRAKAGKLKLDEFQGGTFSISNLGMYGIKEFAAARPPHGCILAVGAGEQRPVVKDGALGIATVMSCTLSVDHRVVDGAVGAQFLAAFKKLIEDPLTMLL